MWWQNCECLIALGTPDSTFSSFSLVDTVAQVHNNQHSQRATVPCTCHSIWVQARVSSACAEPTGCVVREHRNTPTLGAMRAKQTELKINGGCVHYFQILPKDWNYLLVYKNIKFLFYWALLRTNFTGIIEPNDDKIMIRSDSFKNKMTRFSTTIAFLLTNRFVLTYCTTVC